jgi:hypothetical protein
MIRHDPSFISFVPAVLHVDRMKSGLILGSGTVGYRFSFSILRYILFLEYGTDVTYGTVPVPSVSIVS